MSNPFGMPPNNPPPYGQPPPPYGQPGGYPPPYPQPPYPQQAGPPMYGQPLPPGTVKTWLVESVLALIFCGGLLAIPAVIFAAQVDSHLRQGNYQAALEASSNAKMWLMIAVGVAVAFFFFCSMPMCVLYILAAIAGAVA